MGWDLRNRIRHIFCGQDPFLREIIVRTLSVLLLAAILGLGTYPFRYYSVGMDFPQGIALIHLAAISVTYLVAIAGVTVARFLIWFRVQVYEWWAENTPPYSQEIQTGWRSHTEFNPAAPVGNDAVNTDTLHARSRKYLGRAAAAHVILAWMALIIENSKVDLQLMSKTISFAITFIAAIFGGLPAIGTALAAQSNLNLPSGVIVIIAFGLGIPALFAAVGVRNILFEFEAFFREKMVKVAHNEERLLNAAILLFYILILIGAYLLYRGTIEAALSMLWG